MAWGFWSQTKRTELVFLIIDFTAICHSFFRFGLNANLLLRCTVIPINFHISKNYGPQRRIFYCLGFLFFLTEVNTVDLTLWNPIRYFLRRSALFWMYALFEISTLSVYQSLLANERLAWVVWRTLFLIQNSWAHNLLDSEWLALKSFILFTVRFWKMKRATLHFQRFYRLLERISGKLGLAVVVLGRMGAVIWYSPTASFCVYMVSISIVSFLRAILLRYLIIMLQFFKMKLLEKIEILIGKVHYYN